MILKTYEDSLLNMSFEMMLAQLMNLPVKFLLTDSITIMDKYKNQEGIDIKNEIKEEKHKVIDKFDR